MIHAAPLECPETSAIEARRPEWPTTARDPGWAMDDEAEIPEVPMTMEIVKQRLQQGWEAFSAATGDLDAALDPLIHARRTDGAYDSIAWRESLAALSKYLREYAVPPELPVKAAGRGRGQAVFSEML